MPALLSTRTQRQTSPLERALLFCTASVLVVGGVYLWAVLAAPAAPQQLVAVGGAAAVVLVSAAVAVAAYFADTARRLRDERRGSATSAMRLEQEAKRLSETILPAIGHRLQEGASAQAVLSEIPKLAHPTLRRLLKELAHVLDVEKRNSTSAIVARSAMEEELLRLADEGLPALNKRLEEDNASVDAALAEVAQPAQPMVRRLWDEMAHTLGDRNRKGAAAMAACSNAAARIQAQGTTLLARLRELEDRYGEHEDVFGDLLELDHHISQMGRLADNIALLSGGRSGRRWTKPIPMESILRGAIGRIGAYQRVQLHFTSTAAVAGYAAEGVMHTLAELTENATTFSPHGTAVHVYVEEEDAGVVVTIEDSGLGMRARERHRAETLVSQPLDLTTLSGTRLGLAVVGRLATKYGLTVNFRPSSRGGTGVVVLIPRHMITYSRWEGEAVSPNAANPAAQSPDLPAGPSGYDAYPESPALSDPPQLDGEEPILPKRPRGQTLQSAARPRTAPASSGPAQERPSSPTRFAAFRQAGGTARGPNPGEEQRGG